MFFSLYSRTKIFILQQKGINICLRLVGSSLSINNSIIPYGVLEKEGKVRPQILRFTMIYSLNQRKAGQGVSFGYRLNTGWSSS